MKSNKNAFIIVKTIAFNGFAISLSIEGLVKKNVIIKKYRINQIIIIKLLIKKIFKSIFLLFFSVSPFSVIITSTYIEIN
jgi:hypothetical protein